jgi:ribosomal protein L12E/L44/L45/RPP1/RPP2
MPAFPFSASLFYITAKIDRGFASLLQASENGNNSATIGPRVSMTEKVRIKSLVEATRIMAVNVASSAGHSARMSDFSELDTENEDEEDTDDTIEDHRDGTSGMSMSLGLSKIYKRTLEILGDSLLDGTFPQVQDTEDLPMS